MSKSWRIVIRVFLIVVVGVVIIGIINFFPTWSLGTTNMKVFEGEWLDVYYEKEELAAKDVFEYADANVKEVAKQLGFTDKQNVNIYIYDDQSTMQTKKYGLIAPFLGLDWYIGDNIGTNVILTSPANPGKVHDYDTIKYAVLHEVVHAYVSVINPTIDLWLTEGVALYLSNGEPFSKEYLTFKRIPTYNETCTINPIEFANSNGYTFAHTYIEFIDKNYSWSQVVELVKTEDYEGILGKAREDLYDEWVDYLHHYSQ